MAPTPLLPNELDSMAQACWGPIYEGDGSDEELLVSKFCAAYEQHLSLAPEFHLDPIKPSQLAKALKGSCQEGPWA